jgi:tryptophan halogenase
MRLLVIGGGTAGWITALTLRDKLPDLEITLIESAEIGILGAGEGVTPHFIGHFLDEVGIPVSEVIRHAGATLKHGIRFTNWTGDGSYYFHPFDDHVTPRLDLKLLHPERPLDSPLLNFGAYTSERGRVMFTPKYAAEQDPSANPLSNLVSHANYAMHFDAVRLAAFLKRVGVERGIRLIDGRVVDFVQDDEGNVAEVRLDDGRSFPCDLLFDCTGFARLTLGKLFGVKWRSLKKTLPVDRAIPFFVPHEGPLPAYTEAIAMDAGWTWKIPVQERFGCGYVFDSEFLDADGARAEIRRTFGEGIEAPRVLAFDAGYYEQIWVKNCFAVGLSTGFLEPIEATSIWVSVATLREYLRGYLAVGDDRARREFNRFYQTFMQRVVDFLYLHYLTPRQDTPFWATFRERTEAPEWVQTVLDEGGYRWFFEEPAEYGGNPLPFLSFAWVQVSRGLGLMNRDVIAKFWDYYGMHAGFDERMRDHRQRLDGYADSCIAHEEFLARMLENRR